MSESKISSRKVSIASTTLQRKRSSLKHIAQSVTAMFGLKRMSRGMSLHRVSEKPLIKLENTYKTEPDQRFPVTRAREAIYTLFEPILCGKRYDPSEAPRLICSLTNMTKNRMKDLGYDRYKYVVQIAYGQVNDQGFRMASRALWNSQSDNYLTVEYKNDSIFLVCIVHAVYLD
ncbi:DgyrCDS11822 [Dimorphilus gyrociliatus]|uniref:DgyrCDS11822 n=1 Tax=Dimorphilus gyrociliatus TaxID=2664684 RepID=A0A7I8W4R9_9ANNE|nr:DgyrCDS11822 [Dimorphilus gyrociliatus]